MRIILYANKNSRQLEKLRKAVETEIMDNHMEMCRTVKKLIQCLITPHGEKDVIIVMTNDQKDLTALTTIADLFLGKSTILILPDTRKETFALGCKLFPRFVSFSDSDFCDVAAVLHNILVRNQLSAGKIKNQLQCQLEQQ